MIAVIRRSRQLYSDPVTDYMTGYVDHLILGAASYQTDYQVQIRVYRGYGKNSGNTVYIPPSECRSDFSDIRFVDTAGRLLPYWIETTGTNYADIWVKLYQIPTTGAIIKILYGGGSIAAGSNGFDTFQLFDDFSGSAVDAAKWTTAQTPAISNGVLSLAGTSGEKIDSVATFDATYAAMTYAQMTKLYSAGFGWRNTTSGYNSRFYTNYPVATGYNAYNNSGGEASTNLGGSYTGYHIWEVARNSTTSDIFSIDGTVVETLTNQVPSGAISVTFGIDHASATVDADWVAVRKYLASGPSHGWWGSLEDL